MQHIPFNDLARQYDIHGSALSDAVERVMKSGWFLNGEETRSFENEFATFNGLPHVAACSSGTDALELLLRAWGIGPGDEVLVPANTWVSDAEVVVRVGARPVFVDVRLEDGSLDLMDVAAKRTENTRALIVVHLYGCLQPIRPLRTLLGPDVFMLEDYAHASGVPVIDRGEDSFGDAFAFSFYPTKNLGALGDAGAVGSFNESLIDEIKLLRDHGQQQRDAHVRLGATNRIDEIQAAVLRYKLKFLPQWIHRRKEISALYDAAVSSSRLTAAFDPTATNACHLYVINYKNREELTDYLQKNAVGFGIHYPVAIPDIPIFRSEGSRCVNATDRADGILSLPLFPELTNLEVERVCHLIRSF